MNINEIRLADVMARGVEEITLTKDGESATPYELANYLNLHRDEWANSLNKGDDRTEECKELEQMTEEYFK